MKPLNSLLVATAVVVGMGNVPLFAQAKQPTSQAKQAAPTSGKHFQIEAKITKIEKTTGQITLETTKIPGHEGAALSLSYKVAHPMALEMFKTGDIVSADLYGTGKGPMVQSISSLPESKQLGMVDEVKNPDRGPADTTCIDVCASANAQPGVSPQSDTPRDSASARVDVQGIAESPVQTKSPDNAGPSVPASTSLHFSGKVSSVDQASRQITITVDGVPGTATGPTTLTYAVPDSIALSAYHEGDAVNGNVVVSDNLTKIETLQLGKGESQPTTDTQQPTEPKPDTPKTIEPATEPKPDTPKTPEPPKDPNTKY